MKKRSLKPLAEAEMEVLQHVWDFGEATVADVHERVLQNREVAYTTVMTLLKRVAAKGYLNVEKEGPAYVYSPAQPADEVQGNVLSNVIEKVFRGSPVSLVQMLVKREDLSDEEREEILGLIQRLKK